MTETTTEIVPETDEQTTEDVAVQEETTEEEETEPETFPRDYVEKLRKEAGDHRARAKDRDALAARLHLAQVAALGKLADPTDLPFTEDLLDQEALAAAVDDLLARKPHLASRRPAGDVGQGTSGATDHGVDLAGLLRARA